MCLQLRSSAASYSSLPPKDAHFVSLLVYGLAWILTLFLLLQGPLAVLATRMDSS